MPRNLTSGELSAIEQRADLAFRYGDTGALRAEDVYDLITEVRDMWRLREHLIALNRQGLDRLAALGEPAEPADPDLDPP